MDVNAKILRKPLWLLATVLLISGCEPSYKEDYEALKRELEVTRQELLAVREQLKATNNEIRHRIFTLIRRSNTHLRQNLGDIEFERLREYMQEMQVHIDSYQQLNTEPDHVSSTANFYQKKLQQVNNLLKDSRSAYNRQYNQCKSSIEGRGDVSTMLCEVQADMAKQELQTELLASIEALEQITNRQIKAGRHSDSSTVRLADLEQQFRSLVAELKQQSSP